MSDLFLYLNEDDQVTAGTSALPHHDVSVRFGSHAWVQLPSTVAAALRDELTRHLGSHPALVEHAREQVCAIVHHALFREDDDDPGPVFRWHETLQLAHDDDLLLKCAADHVVNDLMAHPQLLRALAAVVEPPLTEPMRTCDEREENSE